MTRTRVGGWLLVFALLGVGTVCMNGYTVVRDSYRALLFSNSTTARVHALMPFVAVRLATAWFFVLAYVIGLTLIATRAASTVRYWRMALLCCTAVVGVRVVTLVWEHSFLVSTPATTASSTPQRVLVLRWPYSLVALILSGVVTLAWWLYWRRSTRVSETFPTPVHDAAA